jgi:Xaa-Pro dipeptidase
VIITEFSASYWGYSGQIHRPVFVGAEPMPEWQRLFDVALEAYDRLARAVRAGATEVDALDAAAVIPDAGYAIYDDLLHGYGVDILPPLIDRHQLSRARVRSDVSGGSGMIGAAGKARAPSEAGSQAVPPQLGAPSRTDGSRFEAGMAVVLQPNPVTPDERMGLQLGALTIVREGGAECLHGVPFEPLIA